MYLLSLYMYHQTVNSESDKEQVRYLTEPITACSLEKGKNIYDIK